MAMSVFISPSNESIGYRYLHIRPFSCDRHLSEPCLEMDRDLYLDGMQALHVDPAGEGRSGDPALR